MSRIRHATETFVNNLIEGIKKLIASNTEQINVLLQRNHLPAKDNRGVVTKPSDYKSQFTFAGLKSEGVTGLPTWSHVFGVNAYSGIDGFTNVYEYAFCNGEMYIRNQYPLNEDTWGEWQQLATTSKTDILFQGAATTTFTLAKSFSGYDEFKVMGYTASHTHSTYTHNNFDFNTLGNTESGYLVFGVGVVQFQCNGTEFKILSNPNNVIISKIAAIERGDK